MNALPIEKNGEGKVIVSGLEHVEALIRFYFNEDPIEWYNDQSGFMKLARAWGQLEYALVVDGKLDPPQKAQIDADEFDLSYFIDDAESNLDN